MTFAILTPALITGSLAERMKFSSLCVFMVAWSLLVYAPICHWVWASDGFFFQMGALDYAGGTVVHINAGIAAAKQIEGFLKEGCEKFRVNK